MRSSLVMTASQRVLMAYVWGIYAFSIMLVLPTVVLSAPLYQNDFETDTALSWTVNKGPATTDEAHDFFFNYSNVGIPPAPHSGALGTRGMKLQANQSSGVFGGVSVSPTGESFTGDYELQFDWWSNFNGPAPVGGSGSTQLSTFGIGTSGTVAQWPGGVQDSVWFGGTTDGNSSQDWRAYSPTAPTSYVAGTAISNPIFAAPFVSGFDNRNQDHPYYATFGANAAPAAQTALFPQQTGVTLVGSSPFEWHEVIIKNAGGLVTWTVDGTLIATVPKGDDTVATGNNIFFGHADTNATSSTDVNDVNLLFTLIDNVRVVPEPSSLSLFALGLVALLPRWRR